MNQYFYQTITQLRNKEEIILYDKLLNFENEDEIILAQFLEDEYEIECQNYPYIAPDFDKNAALWAAKITYTACQILLYRLHREEELPNLLHTFSGEITVSTMLSADLCLRFLPQILQEAKAIDSQDALIPILEEILNLWHFSGIGEEFSGDNNTLGIVFENKCLEQLYIDRIVNRKDTQRAKHPLLEPKINDLLGLYSEIFWNGFNKKNNKNG
jgi:hypothetical protein